MFFTSVANSNDARPIIMRLDYTGMSNGQPLYQGYAMTGTDEGTNEWMIYKYAVDGSGYVTKRDVAYGSWTGRAGLTFK